MPMPAETPKTKTIWVDLDNSPHVPFFMPIIARLRDKGLVVEVTARDCFQVCGLADRNQLRYRRIGRHYGKNIALKAFGTLLRAVQLCTSAVRFKPDIAISHGSRAMNIAAAALNITTIEMTDYEFARDVPFVHPALLIAPEVVALEGMVGGKTKTASYPGIKEDVYVPFFKPDGSIKSELGILDEMTVVTIRPPATEAHYHKPESEVLFSEVLNRSFRDK